MRVKWPLLVALGVCHAVMGATPEPKSAQSAPAAGSPRFTLAQLTTFIDTYEA